MTFDPDAIERLTPVRFWALMAFVLLAELFLLIQLIQPE